MVTPILRVRSSPDPETYPVCTRTPETSRWRLNCCCCHYTSALKSTLPEFAAEVTLETTATPATTSTPKAAPTPLPILPSRCPVASCRHELCKKGCVFYEQERVWECHSCGGRNSAEKRRCTGMVKTGWCDKPLGGEDCWKWIVGRFPGEGERMEMGRGWGEWV